MKSVKHLTIDQQTAIRESLARLSEANSNAPIEDKLAAIFGSDQVTLSESELWRLIGRRTASGKDKMKAWLRANCEAGPSFLPGDSSQGCERYRLLGGAWKWLQVPCTAVKLSSNWRLTAQAPAQALRAVSRIDPLDLTTMSGSQRKEIRNHIADIARGIQEGTPVPSSLVLLWDQDHVRFEPPEDARTESAFVVLGDGNPDEGVCATFWFAWRPDQFLTERHAFLCDGQQRQAAATKAMAESRDNIIFPLNIFIDDSAEARRIFEVANNSRPIPTKHKDALKGIQGKGLAESAMVKLVADRLRIKPFVGRVFFDSADDGLRNINSSAILGSLRRMEGWAVAAQTSEPRTPKELATYLGSVFRPIASAYPSEWSKGSREAALTKKAVMEVLTRVVLARTEFVDMPERQQRIRKNTKRLRRSAKLLAAQLIAAQLPFSEPPEAEVVKRSLWLTEVSTWEDTKASKDAAVKTIDNVTRDSV